MILLIDGDFIPWVVSYNCREAAYPYEVEQEVDRIVEDLISRSSATAVIGYLGRPHSKSFRVQIATLRDYKGKRGEKPEYFEKWGRMIEGYLVGKYGFTYSTELGITEEYGTLAYETDDMVCAHSAHLRAQISPHIICSTDKDLKQIPGTHLNPTKLEFCEIDEAQAKLNLWMQVLTGDSTDNIPGLPKCGPVGADKVLRGDGGFITEAELPFRALNAYIEKHGEHQGILNFTENYQLVKLIDHIGPELLADVYVPGGMTL